MVLMDSLYIEHEDYTLHVKHIHTGKKGTPVFLLHGSIEDGRIFYSKSGKGLAPFLAEHGFDAYVADLRGRGKSTPKIDETAEHGQREAILEDLPAFISFITDHNGKSPKHFLAHSWGGVLLLSYLARFENPDVQSMILFGSKRDVRVQNLYKWFNIDFLWNRMGTYLVHKYGYLPAVKYKVGSDNEAKNFYLQINNWVYSQDWIDMHDGFDYGGKLREMSLPATLYLTGAKDTHSGHKKDVKRLKAEVGDKPTDDFRLIGKKTGYQFDYDHINLLTHPKAREDHFPDVVNWMRKHE